MTTESKSVATLEQARADLASLDRVSHRLAMTTDDKLPQVLDKLLPRLLRRVGDNNQMQVRLRLNAIDANAESDKESEQQALRETLDRIHAKLVEMLSHVMKRVRGDPQHCVLPVAAILELLMEEEQEKDNNNGVKNESESFPSRPRARSNVDPFTMNLSFAFLQVGIPHVSTFDQQALLPNLLLCLHQATLNPKRPAVPAHLILHCIYTMVKAEQNGKHEPNTTKNTVNHAALAQVRRLLHEQPPIAAALYDLFLDVLLNFRHVQPTTAATNTTSNTTASSIPPDGLSQTGHERLMQAWIHTPTTLTPSMLKLAVLDCIAPSRTFALLAPPPQDLVSNTAQNSVPLVSNDPNKRQQQYGGGDSESASLQDLYLEPQNDTKEQSQLGSLGWTRTVALLVAASGDAASEAVVEKAKAYLKMHLDSYRGRQADKPQQQALGNAQLLAASLLSLCLGQSRAESILLSHLNENKKRMSLSLGQELWSGAESPQIVLATKRRAVSEIAMASIATFVASNILEEYPNLFECTTCSNNDDEDTGDDDSDNLYWVLAIGSLSVHVARRCLSPNMVSTSGWTATRGRPFIAAAQLLQAVAIRLSVFDGAQPTMERRSSESSNSTKLRELLAQVFETACSCLSSLSESSSSSTINTSSLMDASNEGNLAVRDACYGTIATLCRSQFILAPEGFVFNGGTAMTGTSCNNAAVAISTQTAKLLFGCTVNEHEKLRPRAVAALDALLGSYMRVYLTRVPLHLMRESSSGMSEVTEAASKDSTHADGNPWASTIDFATKAHTDTTTLDHIALSKALLPLLWTAAQGYQPKASRVASARWSTDLLRELDLNSACHLLCFLAGDVDPTAASIAREGLGLGRIPTDNISSSANDTVKFPDFGAITQSLYPARSTGASQRLQTYWEFTFQGKAVSLRFSLLCLLHDLYDGGNQAIGSYLAALTETLHQLLKGRASANPAASRQSMDLLDECSSCFLAVISSSQFARSQVLAGATHVRVNDLEEFSLIASSSKARRYLAGSCGELYLHWGSGTSDKELSTVVEWISTTRVDRALSVACDKLSTLGNVASSSGELHGSAFLGAYALRAFRLNALKWQGAEDEVVSHCWNQASLVLIALGQGTNHPNEVFGKACADCIGIALSFDGYDAPILDAKLYTSSVSILTNLTASLRKYGHGDTLDVMRTMRLANAAGAALAATTSGSGLSIDPFSLGSASGNLGASRLGCVEELFNLLGSMAFRKDEEIGIIAGEALAAYADAFSPADVVWDATEEDWPDKYSEEFAQHLAPHRHVLYVLITKTLVSSSPQTRTSTAPALLAIVARAAKGVRTMLLATPFHGAFPQCFSTSFRR